MGTNNIDLINDLLDKHRSKFKYSLYFIDPTGNLIDEFLFGSGYKNNEVIEFINLLQKSINDNFDYLPEKYNFNPKDIIGEFPDIVVD